MAKINQGRLTVDNNNDIVVFLIGARVNKWWLLPLSIPVLSKMRNMLMELIADPQSGLLGIQPLGLSGMVQYWRSVEDLNRYANDKQKTHRPAWVLYMKKLFKNVSAGIWHETFVVKAGSYESIYTNMPSFGMGTFKELISPAGKTNTALGRLNATE